MNKAISPAIVAILLMLIAISAGVIIYTYTIGFLGGYTPELIITEELCIYSGGGWYIYTFEHTRKLSYNLIEIQSVSEDECKSG